MARSVAGGRKRLRFAVLIGISHWGRHGGTLRSGRHQEAPQNLEIEVDQFSRKEAIAAASYLSFVVGEAHARQLSDSDRMFWRDQLDARDGKLDAPSWLWQAIVAMAGAHEAGDLEHCRRFALNK